MEFQRSSITPNERPPKYVIVIFLLFSVFIVVLGAFQIRNQVYSSLDVTLPKQGDNDVLLSFEDATQKILEENSRDTDSDGLLDYDELYLYNTSPYLPDSDGDGAPDGEEIQKNTDPNCPPGKTCERVEEQNVNAGPSPQDLEDVIPKIGDDTAFFPKGEELRKMLISGGVDLTIIESMSDADLEALFKKSYETVTNPESAAQNLSNTLDDTQSTDSTIDAETLKKILESLQTSTQP